MRFGACSAAFLAKAGRHVHLAPACQLGNYFERRVYMPDQKIIMEGEEPRYGASRRRYDMIYYPI